MILLCCCVVLQGCRNATRPSTQKNNLVENQPVPTRTEEASTNRSSWQKPDLVLSKLGDIEGKSIADIGTGTGYFAYRMAYKGAHVIAIDVDADMLDLMQNFKVNLPSTVAQNLKTRLVPPDDPKIMEEEADHAIIINTIAYIDNRPTYCAKVRNGLKPGGSLMIVDFKYQDLDIDAPPLEQRVPIGTLQSELKKAGFNDIEVDDQSLQYQYIITATR